MNNITVIGNVGRIDTSHVDKGVFSFTIADNYRSNKGEQKTQWHRITVFQSNAPLWKFVTGKNSHGDNIRVGPALFVCGSLVEATYTKNDGTTGISSDITASNIMYASTGRSSGVETRGNATASAPASAPQEMEVEELDYDVSSDDLPF